MLPVACSNLLSPLVPVHRQSNRISVRLAKTPFTNQDSPYGPWRSFGGPVTSLSPPKIRWHTQRPGADGDPTHGVHRVADESRVASGGSGSQATSFLSLLCPLLKFFGGGDPSQERNEFLEVASSSLSSLARFPWGSKSLNSTDNVVSAASPQTRLQVYEFEACPFCRRVREAMTELDLTVEVYPCPKGSLRHRDLVRSTGGKEQFPFLVDLNTGVSMYESSFIFVLSTYYCTRLVNVCDSMYLLIPVQGWCFHVPGDIVKYLFQQYGQGRKPSFGLLESTVLTGWVPTLLRAGRGMTLWKNAEREPPMKLELFSYENNAYSRIVREALCELELPYILHNVGEGSAKSKLLLEISGSKEVPYLVDPNTGVQMGDYKKIASYLFQTYSTSN